jgi:hypothetical protein
LTATTAASLSDFSSLGLPSIAALASVVGMSFGGWVSGVIFDTTGSYGAAFLNGLAWNAVNVTIMVALLIRARQRLAMA